MTLLGGGFFGSMTLIQSYHSSLPANPTFFFSSLLFHIWISILTFLVLFLGLPTLSPGSFTIAESSLLSQYLSLLWTDTFIANCSTLSPCLFKIPDFFLLERTPVYIFHLALILGMILIGGFGHLTISLYTWIWSKKNNPIPTLLSKESFPLPLPLPHQQLQPQYQFQSGSQSGSFSISKSQSPSKSQHRRKETSLKINPTIPLPSCTPLQTLEYITSIPSTSLVFVSTATCTVAFILRPWVSVFLHEEPFGWVWHRITSHPNPTLISLWILTLSSIYYLKDTLSLLPVSPSSLNLKRKYYHLIAMLIIVPGTLSSYNFMHLSLSFGLSFLMGCEILRVLKVKPWSDTIQGFVSEFLDSKDEEGTWILSHLYLLGGCGGGVWLNSLLISSSPAPFQFLSSVDLLPLTGLIVLGVGDSMASVLGLSYGKHRWWGTKKTLEGTFGGMILMVGGTGILLECLFGHGFCEQSRVSWLNWWTCVFLTGKILKSHHFSISATSQRHNV